MMYIFQYTSPFTPRSPMGSSHYLGTPLFVSPIEDVLVRRVTKMGHELAALKIRSERSYKLDFNVTLGFTSKIMEDAIPP